MKAFVIQLLRSGTWRKLSTVRVADAETERGKREAEEAARLEAFRQFSGWQTHFDAEGLPVRMLEGLTR